MIKIPALRFGKPYTSLDKATLIHHATGEPVAEVRQVTGSQIASELGGMARAKKEMDAIKISDFALEHFRGPRLSEHTEEVLSGYLGISPPEIAELRREGVI